MRRNGERRNDRGKKTGGRLGEEDGEMRERREVRRRGGEREGKGRRWRSDMERGKRDGGEGASCLLVGYSMPF